MRKLVAFFIPVYLLFILVVSGCADKDVRPAAKNVETSTQSHSNKAGNTFVNSIGMKMIYVPAGEFMMGTRMSPSEIVTKYGGKEEGFKSELPRHKVTLSKGFWMGAYEVTRGQFSDFVAQTGYKTSAELTGSGYGMTNKGWRLVEGITWRNPGFDQADNHPVVQISWEDAAAFCKWLSKKEGKNYSLPSEAQWEYACRAGTTTEFSWGDEAEQSIYYANICDESANNALKKEFNRQYDFYLKEDDHYAYTAPVGTFKQNGFGLYDMHGNAWEWCFDWYTPYDPAAVEDPEGQLSGSTHVLRGGGWRSRPNICRSSTRYRMPQIAESCVTGFRIVLPY